MSWTLSTSGACIAKAGSGANSTIVASSATLAKWSDEAEGQVIGVSDGYDWVANYASVGTNFKTILDDAVSDLVAMRIVNYDMAGYTSRQEATTILDVIRDNYERLREILSNANKRKKMGGV